MKKNINLKSICMKLAVIFLSLMLSNCYKNMSPVPLDNAAADIMTTLTGYVPDTTYSTGTDLSSNLEILSPADAANSFEGLRDLNFQQGAILLSPVEGTIIQDTILDFGYGNVAPVWTVAQWASKLSLKNNSFSILANGDRTYTNDAKTLAFNPDGSFKLELKGKYEWGDSIRKWGDSWPHLYLKQSVYPQKKIPISQCTNIFFSLDGIREYCYNYMGDSLNPSLHTAQVVINLIIQNRNPQSSFFGKYYTIQLPCYDFRYDFPPGINRYDIAGSKETATGSLMYGPAADQIWDGTFKDGQWHKIRKNILPLILEAWPIATKPDSPLDGADINDFYLATVSIGWEVPGVFDASMRFKNFSIKAVLETP